MTDMESHSLISWTMAHPDAATALATMALVTIGALIGLGQIGVVFYGIKKMSEGNKDRTANHDESMRAHSETKEAETKRHEEAMTAETNRHQEAMRALGALIRNTSAGPAPAE